MDAVEYIKERERMCADHDDCVGCGLRCEIRGLCGEDAMRVEDVVRVVEQWSREHPVMTNAQKFEEVFGEKPTISNGELMCPPIVFRESKDCSCKCSECDQWWNEPYKEPEGKE